MIKSIYLLAFNISNTRSLSVSSTNPTTSSGIEEFLKPSFMAFTKAKLELIADELPP